MIEFKPKFWNKRENKFEELPDPEPFQRVEEVIEDMEYVIIGCSPYKMDLGVFAVNKGFKKHE